MSEPAPLIPVVAVVGPTASGKSALAVELARLLNGEIVSADSKQIYRYMSVGTAVPTEEEMAGIPHHLLQFLNQALFLWFFLQSLLIHMHKDT